MSEVADMPLDELVKVYRRIRDAVDAKEEAFKEEVGVLKGQLDTITTAILDICNTQNVDSIRTPEGTITRRVAERFWTTDWESMHKFVMENEAPFLLEQRIHNGNMKQFLEENPEAFPAGLQCDRKYAITVRKPTKK